MPSPRDYLCEYGNCQSVETPIIVTEKDGRRVRFCSWWHTALWVLREWRRERGYVRETKAFATDPRVNLHDLVADDGDF